MKKEALEKILEENFEEINLYGNGTTKEFKFNKDPVPKENFLIGKEYITITYPERKIYVDIDSIKSVELITNNKWGWEHS